MVVSKISNLKKNKKEMAPANRPPKQTPIMLGFPALLTEFFGNVDEFACFFGGEARFPVQYPPDKLALCTHCHSSDFLTLWTQIYAPLVDSPYHRFIYVYACHSMRCMHGRTSLLVIKAQYLDFDWLKRRLVEVTSAKKPQKSAPLSFDAASPWTSCGWDDISNALDDISALPVALAPDRLEFVEEGCPSTKIPQGPSKWANLPEFAHEMDLLKEYEKRHGKSISTNEMDDTDDAWSGEKYEKAHKYDKTFKIFHETISRSPSQCIRYGYGGSPLVFQRDIIADLIERDKKCLRCGSLMIFEFQLMPALVSAMPRRQPNSALAECSEMDFASAYIFTCSRNCDQLLQNRMATGRDIEAHLETLRKGEPEVSFNVELGLVQIESDARLEIIAENKTLPL
eukprot:Partr_v1_DN26118_c1_g1_i4_m10273 putative Programmed cell death